MVMAGAIVIVKKAPEPVVVTVAEAEPEVMRVVTAPSASAAYRSQKTGAEAPLALAAMVTLIML